MSVLTSVAAFVVAIGILVAVHEFGHFWVARKLGVKVLRFSIGFGNVIWRKQSATDETEYVISAIPLGGYVKMLDEREGEVAPAELHRAFNRQPVRNRFAIVAAGPIFNFLFAIVAYAVMFMVGVSGTQPVIGTVDPASLAAKAGIAPGWEIVAIDGHETATWEAVTLRMVDLALKRDTVQLQLRDAGGAIEERYLDLAEGNALLDEGDLLRKLGITPRKPRVPAVFGELVANGPAARAGLAAGDRVVEIDGKAVAQWQDVVDAVQMRPGQPVNMVIERGGQPREVVVVADSVAQGDRTIGRIGARPHVDQAELAAMRVEVRYGPFEALVKGVERTWEMSALTLRMLWKMLMGEASVKNISGPLTIAEFAGVSALIGVSAFLGFLGLVSVSLGVLNLVPVPVLDGGHLLFYLIEWVKGKPLSERAEALGQKVGLAILGALMILAFYNDITRLLS